MSGLIINGASVSVEGRRVINWHDEPRLRLSRYDGRQRRTTWIRQVILHTTKGIPGGADRRQQVIIPGHGRSTNAGVRTALFWTQDPKSSGAHLVIDHDETVYCLADLATEVAYHATVVNDSSVGIELYQGGGAEMYKGQLECARDVIGAITVAFGIQRQIPHRYMGGPLRRLESGGRDIIGVFGHRDVTSNRGSGDPGDAVFDVLARAGYERWDFARLQDVTAWQERQAKLGISPDGIPGRMTVAALRARGYTGGLWALPPAEAMA